MSHRITKRLAVLTLGVFAVVAAGCSGAEAGMPGSSIKTPEPTQEKPPSTINETEARVWLQAPNGKHQTGWAEIREQNGSLFIDIDVSPSEAVAQPAHIHRGNCEMLGVIDHRLENIIAGKSSTELPDVSLSDLAAGDHAINLHLSFADFSTFTACGEIPALETRPLPIQQDPVQSDQGETGYGF